MSNDKKGWIALHRSIQDHWLWDDKPFSKGQAWADMLMCANHQDNKFLLGNSFVEVERGSFITSELKLMERFGWSKTKLRSFLKVLENDSMIIKKTDRKKTTITIVKYSDYQDLQTTEEPQKNHRKTAKKPQKDTNNNVNNENNEEQNNIGAKSTTKKSSSQFKPPTVEEVREYIELKGYSVDPEDFHDYYSASGWTLSNGRKMKAWKPAVNRWERNQSNWGKGTTERKKVEENSDKGGKYASVFENYKNL